MKLTNNEVYSYYKELNSAFDNANRYFPAKISFYIQKNKQLLGNIVTAIETTREKIGKEYGTPDKEIEGLYHIKEEDRGVAQQELKDLMNIQQNVPIHKLTLSEIESLEFTPAQMNAILFMIDDESQVY